MSLIIKFRVWDIARNAYLLEESPNSWFSPLDGRVKHDFWEVFNRPNRFVLEQFTGILDVDGKEIYANDIVSPVVKENIFDKEVVSWLEGTTGFYPFGSQFEWVKYFTNKPATKWKIIGNINQNSDMFLPHGPI